jgi:hypothetical protein
LPAFALNFLIVSRVLSLKKSGPALIFGALHISGRLGADLRGYLRWNWQPLGATGAGRRTVAEKDLAWPLKL